jgi:hypothetical protein
MRAATGEARCNNGFPHRCDAGRGARHDAVEATLPVWHDAAGPDQQCGAKRLVSRGEVGLRKPMVLLFSLRNCGVVLRDW